jgi:hypothetical protein
MGTLNSAPGRRAFETLGFLLREHVVTLNDRPVGQATKNEGIGADLRERLRHDGPSSAAALGAATGLDSKRIGPLLSHDIHRGRVIVYRDARGPKPRLLVYALAPGVRA